MRDRFIESWQIKKKLVERDTQDPKKKDMERARCIRGEMKSKLTQLPEGLLGAMGGK